MSKNGLINLTKVTLQLLAIFTSGAAFADCRNVPLGATPQIFIDMFGRAMARTGSSTWHLITQTSKGPMYISDGTKLRLAVRSNDGLVEEVTLLLSEASPGEVARLEIASSYLMASAAEGAAEADRAEIGKRIERALRSREASAFSRGEGVLVFSSPAEGAVAVAGGRRRCG